MLFRISTGKTLDESSPSMKQFKLKESVVDMIPARMTQYLAD
jgi:hypothetical protein